MMEYFLIALCSLLSSFLSFYSGFGLGTILMPIIAIFFPLPIAIALTAVVHLGHNLIKMRLLWKAVQWKIVAHFGITAAGAAFFGALFLQKLAHVPVIYTYSLFSLHVEMSILHIAIGLLLIGLTVIPFSKKTEKNLYIGGMLNGFLGGFSGHQGAFRSAFLINMNLSKEAYIGTSAVIGSMIDIVRIPVYGWSFYHSIIQIPASLFVISISFAILGIGLGKLFLKNIPLPSIQNTTIFLIILFGILLIAGII